MTAPISRLSTLTLFIMTFSLLVTGNDHSWYGRRRWNECWELSIPDSHIRVPFYHDYGKRSISRTLLARDKKPLHVPSESKNPAFEIPKTALEGANPRTWPGEKGSDWTPVLGADGPFGGVANEEFSASKEFGERPGRDSTWHPKIPPELKTSPILYDSLKCFPKPNGEFLDAHCGNVLWIAHDFCNKNASSFSDHGNMTYNIDNWVLGPRMYDHHEYVPPVDKTPPGKKRLIEYFSHDYDDYNVTISAVPGCVNDLKANGVDRNYHLMQPHRDNWRKWTCHEMIWGAWIGCDSNAGRGGSVQAGCMRYEIKTLH